MKIYIDIGTTTIAAVNEKNQFISVPNPQRKYGGDVVSRLDYAQKNGLSQLRDVLINCVNDIIKQLSGDDDKSVDVVYVSANTAMSCFFAGIDPAPLASFPYQVPEYFGKVFSASELGLAKANSNVFISRCFSAYFGGDVLGGMIAMGLDKADKAFVYVDIGTNGEMAVGTSNRTLFASAAAGPALEGGNVSCGASGVDGAISSIDSVKFENGIVTLDAYKKIGESKECVGLCGSALIDLLALLKKIEAIDEFGVLGAKIELPNGLSLTQDDVCALQLAKSAVRSGIDCLLEAARLDETTSFDVYIAGIMGAKINIDNVCAIGLFPECFRHKTRLVGNMALEGARCMEDINNVKRAEKYALRAKKLSLSGNKHFEALFAENMLL